MAVYATRGGSLDSRSADELTELAEGLPKSREYTAMASYGRAACSCSTSAGERSVLCYRSRTLFTFCND